MEDWILKYGSSADVGRVLANTRELTALEHRQTFPAYETAARRTAEIMRREGLPNVELLDFPADGRTVYGDFRMPLAWDASIGRLVVKSGFGLTPGKVIADFAEEPLTLIKGSVATAPGGEDMGVIAYEQMLTGASTANKLVVLPHEVRPCGPTLKAILDLGARGYITDFSMGRETAPGHVTWQNSATENYDWHVVAGDRDFIAFSVTPEDLAALRTAALRGGVSVHVECDGRRYEDKWYMTTALIPGRRKEEFWMIGHLAEPVLTDNSYGVSVAIEVGRQIMKQGTPEFSVRLVFSLEVYGFAAYAATLGGDLRSKVIGAENFDGLNASPWARSLACTIPSGSRSFGVFGVERVYEALRNSRCPGAPPLGVSCPLDQGSFNDDTLLSDSTIGVATVWFHNRNVRFWHNTMLNEKGALDPICTGYVLGYMRMYAELMVNPVPELLDFAVGAAKRRIAQRGLATGANAEQARCIWELADGDLADFARYESAERVAAARDEVRRFYEAASAGLPREILHSKWRDYAEAMIPHRVGHMNIFSMARVPRGEYFPSLGNIYSPGADLMSQFDGKRSLAEALRRTEYILGRRFSEEEVHRYIGYVGSLARYGYLELENSKRVTIDAVFAALREAGVREGDLLMVHSALGSFGEIEKGAEGVLEALRRAVGDTGTVLLPAFTRPYLYLGGPNTDLRYRPFDAKAPNQICTGTLPKTLLLRHPEAPRSRHVSHSWIGFGPLAAACLAGHGRDDSPCGETSPCGEVLRRGGRILHFGSGFNHTTFLHYLEDRCDLPYLTKALCAYGDPDEKRAELLLVPKHLPGDRDFYRADAENGKFYQRAVARGLKIRTVELGPGKVMLMEAAELARIGLELIGEDRRVLLCDNPKCGFCSRF